MMKIVSPEIHIGVADATSMPSSYAEGARSQIMKSIYLREYLYTSVTEGYRFSYLILDMPEKGQPTKDNQSLGGSTRSAIGRLQSQSKQLMLYITDPAGQRVRDGQAILCLIDPQGHHHMARLDLWGGGYFCHFKLSSFGIYRVETEVITACLILTDLFCLVVDCPANPRCRGKFP